jgi:hypothetical protein
VRPRWLRADGLADRLVTSRTFSRIRLSVSANFRISSRMFHVGLVDIDPVPRQIFRLQADSQLVCQRLVARDGAALRPQAFMSSVDGSRVAREI